MKKKEKGGDTPKTSRGNTLSFEYQGSPEKDSTTGWLCGLVWYKEWEGGGGGWIEFTAGFFLFFPEKVIGKLCGAWAKAARCPGIKKSISISKIVTTLGFRDLDPSFWPWDWPGCPWPAPVLTRQPKESLGTVEQEPHDRALGRRQDRSPWLHATELGWGWAFSRESFWETSKVYHR